MTETPGFAPVLETAIEGDAESIITLGDWLVRRFSAQISTWSDTVNRARQECEGNWHGEAGDACAGRLRTATRRGLDATDQVAALGRDIEAYGYALRSAQVRMSIVRAGATQGGLVVEGTLVFPPGIGPLGAVPAAPAPPRPYGLVGPSPSSRLLTGEGLPFGAATPVPDAATQAQAWVKALEDATFAREQLDEAAAAFADTYRGLQGPEWAIEGVDLAGAFVGAGMETRAVILRRQSKLLAGLADDAFARARSMPVTGQNLGRYFGLLDESRALTGQSAAAVRTATALDDASKSIGLKVAGAAAVVGVGYEIYKGKDPVQATAAGGAGFVASMAAGAAFGTIFPIPVFGTIGGAVVGAGFGIFVSSGVDSLFENGPDIGKAVDAGWDSVTETGGAILGGVKSLGGLL